MALSLTQSALAAFPDRPHPTTGNATGTGVLATLGAGLDGAYLAHAFPTAQTTLHTRILLGHRNATGGAVSILRGLDATATPRFNLIYHFDTQSLQLHAGGQVASVTLDDHLTWQCLEVGLNTTAQTAQLDVNGRTLATLSGLSTLAPITQLWLGGFDKDDALTGTYALDEWVMAQSPIGPVVREPRSPYADDPARWLVVYNRNEATSVQWASRYRGLRDIPFANLLGLPLSTSETIDSASFIALSQAVQGYLDAWGLRERTVGVLLGHGVPGYADLGTLEAIPALLHTDDLIAGSAANPCFNTRPTPAALADVRLTARIDAPDLAAADALTDRGAALSTADLHDGTHVLEPNTTPGSGTTPIINALTAFASSLDRQRLRVPMALLQGASTIAEEGFFWGWAAASAPTGFFEVSSAPRVFVFPLQTLTATGSSLRSGTGWARLALDAGYASAGVSARGYSLSNVPDAATFFRGLRAGWTLAEAWLAALPALRDGLYLVGDPLATVNLPRDGWDLFGPADPLLALDPDTPAQALPASALSTTLSAQPGRWLLRRVDALGRSERSDLSVQVLLQSGQTLPAPPLPLWPLREGWPLRIVQTQLHADAIYEIAPLTLGVTLIELLDESGQVLDSHPPMPHERLITLTAPLPDAPTRYRLRLTGSAGQQTTTPLSARVEPAPLPTLSLTVREVPA